MLSQLADLAESCWKPVLETTSYTEGNSLLTNDGLDDGAGLLSDCCNSGRLRRLEASPYNITWRLNRWGANAFDLLDKGQTILRQTMKRGDWPARAEWVFHVLAFALQCNALLPLLNRSNPDAADSGATGTVATMVNATLLAIVLVLVLTHWRMVLRLTPGMWPLLGLAGLAVLSVAWSDYPAITLLRAGRLATVAMWGWYVVARYDLEDVISIVRQAMWFLASASLAIALGAPSLGQGSDAWIGVFQTKNELGMVMAIGAVTFFYTQLAELFSSRPKFLQIGTCIAGLLLCCGLLYLSQSRTAWVTCFVGLAFCTLTKLTHRRVGVALIVWSTIVLLLAPTIIVAAGQLQTIATMLGKDATLTGRVDLWLVLPSYILQRPWFGHGIGAFWVPDSTNVFEVWMAAGWQPPHAHNGWLDLLLELGAVGWSLAVIQFLLLFANGIRSVVEGKEPAAQYALTMIFVILIHNLAESGLVGPGVHWGLLVIATAALAKIARERRTTRQPRFARRFQHREPVASSRAG